MIVNTKKYGPNAVVYLEGNTNLSQFYIVKRGQIKILKRNTILGNTEYIKSNGYIFGIIACITGIPEEERVETVTECELLIIERDKIAQLYEEHRNIIIKILSEYSEILRQLNAELVQYDIVYESLLRKDKVIKMAQQFIEIGQQKKAAHLLTSYSKECSTEEEEEECKQINEMLKSLPEIEHEISTETMETKTFPPDSVIFTEHETGTHFYVIKHGKVKISKLKRKKETVLALLETGAVFGEMSILNDKPRDATATTEELSEILIINKNSIGKLPSDLFVSILRYLTKRIWMVQQILISMKLPTPTTRIYYYLTAQLKQKFTNLKNKSDIGYTFPFNKEELYHMIDFDPAREKEIQEFLTDSNIDFKFNSIVINDISNFLDKNNYYYTRALLSFKNQN